VYRANDVRQIEMHTAQSLVPEPSAFEFEVVIEDTNHHVTFKSQQNGTNQGIEQFALRSINSKNRRPT